MELDLPPYIRLKNSKRARRLALRLDTRERVFHLVKPSRVSLRKAQDFALNYDQWMQDKLKSLAPPVPFENGRLIPVLGYQRRLRITLDKTLKQTSINMNQKEILVSTYLDDVAPRLKRFFKSLAQETLEAMSEEKAAIVRKRIRSIKTRDTKSRWGSCSQHGELSFSWRLIFAPYEAMDYVVAHEVAHLVHLDHSPRFWAVCESLSDDYEEGKYWMREHGHELMRYGQTQSHY